MLLRLHYERDLVHGEYNEDYTVLTVSKNVFFTLPKNFPFHPPTLFVHSVEYITHLYKWYHRLYPVIKKYKVHLGCICCTVGRNWSPCNNCKQMYEELFYQDKLKRCSLLPYISKLPFDDNVCHMIASFIV
jgi:hypothetical protein